MGSRLALATLALTVSLPVTGAAPAAADGGVWLPTLQATQGFDHLSAFRNGVFYAQYLDTYARSDDHGRTWRVMPKPTGHYYGAPGIRFASPSVGFAVGGGPGAEGALGGDDAFADEIRRCGTVSPLRRTTDGGATWRAVCVPNTSITSDPRWGPDTAGLALAHGGRTIMLSGGEQPLKPAERTCADERDVIYTSHDGGARWTRAALPRGWYGGYRLLAYDRTTLVRLTYGAFEQYGGGGCGSSTTGVFLSRDGGKSFRRVLTCKAPHPCTSVAMPTRNRILVGRTDGTTAISDNGGRTWRRGQRLFDARWQPVVDNGEMSADSFWVQGMSFADARHGFASTRGSGTWRTTDGGISWTQEKSHECAWYLPGIGEVAAGSKDTAITGGPHFISARTPAANAPGGCGATQPQVPAVAATDVVWSTGTARGALAVRVDGSVVARDRR